MSFEFFIGKRYLRAKRKQAFISLITALSVAGVAVGVMALIIVIAVMAGFENDLKSRILGVESHILVMRQGGGFTDYARAMDRIREIGGVEAVTPFVYTQVMLRSTAGISGTVLRGIDPETAASVIDADNFDRASAKLVKNFETIVRPPGVVLGGQLAANLGVSEGDKIYLISPSGLISPIGHMPAMKKFEVVGTFECGMYEYDSSLAYVHIEDARKILRMGTAVTGIEVRIKDIYEAAAISEKIVEDLEHPYWTRDWMERNRNLFSALRLEKTVMFIILTLIVLVAAFNIASSLIMMVMEKTRDIAIMKAMGATDAGIRRIFVIKGMVVGFLGIVLGTSLGVLACELLERYKFIDLPSGVYGIDKLPVKLETPDALMIDAAALVICYLATLYPARQASRLNPSEAFRYG